MRQHHNSIALSGILLLLPALTLCTLGILFSLGMTTAGTLLDKLGWFTHPAIIIGGIATAFLLNLWSVMNRAAHADQSPFSITVIVRKRYSNLIILLLSFLLLAIIFLYLMAENLQIFARY